MTRPYASSAAAKLIAERIRDLSHRKTQDEIAVETGFPNSNMLTYLKQGRSKLPIDRVPALAKALEVDPAHLMRLALDQSVGATAARAITDIFGTPVSANELAWLEEIRDVSGNSDPRLTARLRTALRKAFGK